MICNCYIDEMTYGGTRGKCKGTKECDPCGCNGNKSECDFYDYIRKQGLLEEGRSKHTTVETLIKVLSNYPKDMGVKVITRGKVSKLNEVKTGFNLEENREYIWLVGKE